MSKLVVFITGGSRGIGRAMVAAFHNGGYEVATCATTVSGAQESGADLGVACDVRDPHQVRTAIKSVMQTMGRLDVVINNAGVAGTNPLDPAASDDQWHRIIDVNLHGTYYVCKETAPLLPRGRGRIINIASTLALRGVPDQSAYCAAKHGVLGLTRSLAHALGPRGITVNAICPGWTRSDMAAERWRALGLSEDTAAQQSPLGTIREPEEVAALALYLASEAASGITGQAITLDGGASA